jgi:hypothetical protein
VYPGANVYEPHQIATPGASSLLAESVIDQISHLRVARLAEILIPLTDSKERLRRHQRHEFVHLRSQLEGRLPEDWLEFLLRIALFFALLLGLYLGLIGSWGF